MREFLKEAAAVRPDARQLAWYEIVFDEPQRDLRYVVLYEEIAQGQRVESFQITRENRNLP